MHDTARRPLILILGTATAVSSFHDNPLLSFLLKMPFAGGTDRAELQTVVAWIGEYGPKGEDAAKVEADLKVETAEEGNSDGGKVVDIYKNEDPLIVLGFDLSSQSSAFQFLLCACPCVFCTVCYGYLQELLAVHILGRKYGLFLATFQFAGYAVWSLVLTRLYRHRQVPHASYRNCGDSSSPSYGTCTIDKIGPTTVPLRTYISLSLLRAASLGMSNHALQFINFSTKVLMKSSGVVFTMILGLVIGNKRYRCQEYIAVSLLAVGLGIFLNADSRESSITFHPVGIFMMVVSLVCDGAFGNWSEMTMRNHHIGQDEFQMHLYFIAFLAMFFAAQIQGELVPGFEHFFLAAGTVPEIDTDDDIGDNATWTVRRKVPILFLFSLTGLLGSSCAGAITKRFGALTFSVTSTARKAMTLFLSFVAFHNTCTLEHVIGMIIFFGALIMHSLCATTKLQNEVDAAKECSTASTGISDDGEDNDHETARKEAATCDEASTCSTASIGSSDDGIDDAHGTEIEKRPLMSADDDMLDLEAAKY